MEGYVTLHGSIIPMPCSVSTLWLPFGYPSPRPPHGSIHSENARHHLRVSTRLPYAKSTCTQCSFCVAYLSVGVTSPGDSFSPSSFTLFASSWSSLFSPWPSIEC